MREVCSAAHAQIMMVFYQIATKVNSVYEVELPAAVKQLLNAFSVSFSFGISYTSTPLECLGLHGYRSTLLFWMILPLLLVLIILLASLGVTLVRRKCTLAAFVEVSLPNVLRVLFVVYPLVTNTAFEAFPFHQFSDAAFLKVCTGTQTAFQSCIQRFILRVRRSI